MIGEHSAHVPEMFPPNLQEVGVALRSLDNGIEDRSFYLHSLIKCGLGYGEPGIATRERPYFREVEQPLGIGLCITHRAPELRQTRPDHRDGQLSLGRPVERRNQCRELVLLHILEFVYEEGDVTAIRSGRDSHGFKQVLQIHFQIAIVRQSWLRLEVKADFDVLVLHLESLR